MSRASSRVTNASLHYHFPGKAELGRALIARYARRFLAALAEIDARTDDAPEARGLRRPLRRRAPPSPHVPVRHARGGVPDASGDDARRGDRVLRRERGLARGRARGGTREGSLTFAGAPREAARLIVSALEGAMLVARPYGDVERFETAAERLLAAFAEAS